MFGPRMGFVKFKGEVTDDQGRVIPSIVFMRGASVGMLIVITCEEDKRQYTVLTVQPRVPAGKYALEELPAGMLDSSGSFVGAAAKELQEETGIIVKEKDLIDLTEKAFKGTAYHHVYPSAGGSDEVLRLFLYQVMHTHTRTHTHTHIDTLIHRYIHTHTHTHTHTYIHTCIHAYIHTYIYTYTIHTHTYTHTHTTHTHTRARAHTHTHTHTHTLGFT